MAEDCVMHILIHLVYVLLYSQLVMSSTLCYLLLRVLLALMPKDLHDQIA